MYMHVHVYRDDVSNFRANFLLFSYIWGSLADACGRKPVLVANCVFMAVSALLLAFSVNYTMAVVFRFILGLSNGKACIRMHRSYTYMCMCTWNCITVLFDLCVIKA